MHTFVNQAQKSDQERFEKLADHFNVSTPQQLRDQIIWQGIRRILWLMDHSPDGVEVMKAQDEIFKIAQGADR